MRLLYINPNATVAMTNSIMATARAAAPETEILGWTNHDGPPAIQGAADGEAAVVGLLGMLPRAKAEQVDAIVIACFDDTGLDRVRHAAHCPVIGIGQAAMSVAALHGGAFGIVTTLDVSVPVIAANVDAYGHNAACAGVFASGLPVLAVEAGGTAVEDQLVSTIATAQSAGAKAVVLGCAGMSGLKTALETRTGLPCIDGVATSAVVARAMLL
ncbi:aspartate/glutamate racemase family protein [Marinovum sp. 2_MG-2023]|uniref:aspartate/glutamate racemase family protein n=1 Tax=unclassified Marinovum TaxID=2647166 RepID=UPI0026E42A85|nr:MULTISPECIES: aspartate/glutamate racemase family protein [unclassified Marinovum]MDO6731462.1 aspartate/glutamate racemase family protein [Marinovum sp. 2_MG-2023]MDO6780822.1 aspartate/glutamate racemase family protein [Marinovum sp. 1_MG-2023]